MWIKSLILIFALLTRSSFAEEEMVKYRVKEGDWLAKILRSVGFCPLWGSDGYVSVLEQSNGKVVKREGDLIRTGDVLLIPKLLVSSSDHFKIEGDELEILKYHPRAEGCLKVSEEKEKEEEVLEVEISSHDEEPEVERQPAQVEEAPQVEPPASPLAPKSKEDWSRPYFLSLAPMSDWTKIVGTDLSEGGQATILSELNYGLSVSLSYPLKKNSRFGVVHELSVKNSRWQVSSDRNLSSSNQVLPAMVNGVAYGFSKNLMAIGGASVEKEVFYRALTFPNLEINSLYVPALFVGARWTFFAKSWLRSFLFYRYSYLFGVSNANYSLGSGSKHNFVVGSHFDVLGQRWGADARVAQVAQKSSVVSKEELSTGLRLYWVHRF